MERPLNKDALVEAALDLLSGLSSTPSHRMDIAQAASELALSVAQIEQVVDAIQQLADSYTGTRVGVYLDGRQIVLDGSAGSIAGIRLTHDELLAAEQVIRRFQLDEGVHKRFRDALAPRDDADSKDAQFSFEAMTAADPLFGGFYQQLTEAIADGVRLRIDYTSKRDSKPTPRTIDPGYLFMSHGGAFLAAWDVEKDEQRSYRLPCISAVEETDDSVVPHSYDHKDPRQGISEQGQPVLLRFASKDTRNACDWAEPAQHNPFSASCGPQPDGSIVVCVAWTGSKWLFDQILAKGGDIQLLEPQSVRDELRAYASSLRM